MSRFDLLPDPSDIGGDHDRYAEWIAVAREVAGLLAVDALERDRGNRLPTAEIELLRERGLLTIGIPVEFGGAGVPWTITAQIVRLIARADSSIAHLLGYHYVWLRFIQSFDTDQSRRALVDSAAGRWLWASPGNNRASGYPPIVPDGDGFVITGDSGFASGGPVADRLFAIALRDGDRMTVVELDPADAGITFSGDWDVLGQRLSASQSITLADVRVDESRILRRFGPIREQEARQSVQVLHFQLTFGILHLAIAEGALEAATAYTREHTRPALHSTVERGRDEPYILAGYGTLVAKVQAVSALVERAIHALDWLYALGDEVTAEQRAAVAEIIASAKIVSTDTALEVTSAIFEYTGARSTAAAFGLDRFWRNVRTISLHDPVAYKRDEVGRYVLNGEAPTPSGVR
ncbi:acyl-CoA dehydrogenase family protein [Leifsonia aquatica]|uniref:Alkylation response protein AidB-like acyl-CoA dehydrogenase n=2 Tax=Leifsonia aquatica TaxID=144185 RepID=A0A7W4UX28_LEIAQ|nr:acyl-CoA dehydrogenase family protein [Leifsonia aquatica]ERK70384.1 putative dibenzothiophene desulfurization enzyme [Leifsonia aquatica ATCC 14665]MBB2967885.1 alkylation response protein AidB-like acyl-CoA dehydrogenase [Leifsonia aquatica]